MPTRRILEVAVVTTILLNPIFGLAKMWAGKTLYHTNAGSLSHGTAEIVAVIA